MDFVLTCISLLLLSTLANSKETYENSSELCNRCNCTSGSRFILDCQNQNFHNMLANWPEHSTALTATFSHNNFTNLELMPDSDLVIQIVLSFCGIKTIDNGAFKAVKFLKYLDLSHNLLTAEELGPEQFKGPYNNTVYEPLVIEVLDLSYNQIHSLPHNIFEHLITLKNLNLEGNDFRVLDHPTQTALSSLQNLEVLNLANNELTELVGDAIRSLKKLRTLNLSKNLLDFVPDTLALLEDHLEEVYLDENLIFEITDESFLGVKGIRILSLTNLDRLEYVKANSFAQLKNLTVLYLSDNHALKTVDRDAFAVEQNLEKLYLHNNSLQDLHYNLTNWSALKLLTLTGNDLICDCDLYQISQSLSWDVKDDLDGPFCINPMTDKSLLIYELAEESCEFIDHNSKSHIYTIDHHFRSIRLILVVVSGVTTFATLITLVIAYLRFRRYRMNRNYPFVTQVMYNPLRSPLNGI